MFTATTEASSYDSDTVDMTSEKSVDGDYDAIFDDE